ncbi:hypothetical protein SLEP1_g7457 [Rubroshorea leprosula]|uniref:Glycosyltransferase N-terminal domain-containing protein n=1 Tax=Rubroshorea leprosula TaxID=152421 RepID=A0AAV5I7N6_9ROSI|nr:hypothetical protein SLEP1_g7457 [Rubroshorea leprosula]
MAAALEKKRSILMLPWLAHGHISSFLELAKNLARKNFHILFCSTPINLKPIRENYELMNSIQFIDLHLPPSEELPLHFHTTKDLPPHLMPTLKIALDEAKPEFFSILRTFKPDLVIFDFLQPWVQVAAKEQGIEAVVFMTVGAMTSSFLVYYSISDDSGKEFPFQEIYFPESERQEMLLSMHDAANGKTSGERCLESFKKSSNFVLMRTSREIEGKYIDYLSTLVNKEMVPVGPLVQEPVFNDQDTVMIMNWLSEKEPSSVAYVSFGSEYFLSKEEMGEIALGLELSKVSFFWDVRFHGGDTGWTSIHEVLPDGFLRRIGERGMIFEGCAPQVKILSHESIGGFVSHCGWSSTLESMMFGVPIVAMPMQLDQPLNAKLIVEVGVGREVPKESGKFKKEVVARVIKEVLFAKEGERVRIRAKELGKKMREKRGEEIDVVAKKLAQLVKD